MCQLLPVRKGAPGLRGEAPQDAARHKSRQHISSGMGPSLPHSPTPFRRGSQRCLSAREALPSACKTPSSTSRRQRNPPSTAETVNEMPSFPWTLSMASAPNHMAELGTGNFDEELTLGLLVSERAALEHEVENHKESLFEVRSLLEPETLKIDRLTRDQKQLDVRPEHDCHVTVTNNKVKRFMRPALNARSGGG